VSEPTRVIIRLKHALAADKEIKVVLPDTLEQVEEVIARGPDAEVEVPLPEGCDDNGGRA
jgi:hypothetical protein